MQMFRPLAFAILLVPLILTGILPVEAAVLNGTIKVDITDGGLKGRTFLGDFSYDDSQLTRSGRERMGVNLGGINRFRISGFKTFSLNFVDLQTASTPKLYTQSDDPRFGINGGIIFQDGVPTTLTGLAITDSTTQFTFIISGPLQYQLGGVNDGIGLVSLKVEPKEVPFDFKPLFPIVLLGGFLYFRRYRKKLS